MRLTRKTREIFDDRRTLRVRNQTGFRNPICRRANFRGKQNGRDARGTSNATEIVLHRKLGELGSLLTSQGYRLGAGSEGFAVSAVLAITLRASFLSIALSASPARGRIVSPVAPISGMRLPQLARAPLLIDELESLAAIRLSEDSPHFAGSRTATSHMCREEHFFLRRPSRAFQVTPDTDVEAAGGAGRAASPMPPRALRLL